MKPPVQPDEVNVWAVADQSVRVAGLGHTPEVTQCWMTPKECRLFGVGTENWWPTISSGPPAMQGSTLTRKVWKWKKKNGNKQLSLITKMESDISLGKSPIVSGMKWSQHARRLLFRTWEITSPEMDLGGGETTNNQIQLLIRNLIVMQPPEWNNILFCAPLGGTRCQVFSIQPAALRRLPAFPAQGTFKPH